MSHQGTQLTDIHLVNTKKGKLVRYFIHISYIYHIKANYKNKTTHKKDGWSREGCGTEIETNCHVVICKAYEQVRAGKDLKCDEDPVEFFKKVMKIRMRKTK